MLKLKLIRIEEGEKPVHALVLPERLLRRYALGEAVAADLLPDGFLLRPLRSGKFSWKATAAAMARRKENWTAWEAVLADGLETL